MGTLNDWFTNEGFDQFSVANGKLKKGDAICVEYTMKLGADIGGAVEGNTDTSIKAIAMTNGTMTPAFDTDTKQYMFVLDEGKAVTQLTFTSSNKELPVQSLCQRVYANVPDLVCVGGHGACQSGGCDLCGGRGSELAVHGTR